MLWVSVYRLPITKKNITMKLHWILFGLVLSTCLDAQQTVRQYISGTGSDKTVEWDFFCTGGRKSGEWTRIPVPSNWEQQGFGSYNYGHDKQKADEKGLYKTTFVVPEHYKNQVVYLVFEGSMTDTRVKINGQPAGPVHQGAFNRFTYDITRFVKAGKSNLMEVEVSKMSANSSVNDAERSGDYWIFGGIYRPVYLEIVPYRHIDHVAIDARADGTLSANMSCVRLNKGDILEAEVFSLNGEPAGKPVSSAVDIAGSFSRISGKFDNIRTWSAEFPNLYTLRISLKDNNQVIHQTETRFGFRTVEVREGVGIFVNGTRVILKGVNRHSTNVETGKTLNKAISIRDVNLIKEMNMNAVRMSHYSPDDHFLDVCDSLGLYVLDELAGWQKKYDDIAGPILVKELVEDDVNHPSILFWDNGNEGGWNRNLDDDFALYDPQKRTVIHPWENIYGINTKHYPDYNMAQNTILYSGDIYMPTEFMHGLYDGGHGAGLEDFWNLMMQHQCLGGGFLWVFQDEGIRRTDKDGMIDTDKNHAPDGIVGPNYEKEASFYTIRELWAPVYIDRRTLTAGFNGRIGFENRYSFTNTNACTFNWKLTSFSSPGLWDTVKPVALEGKITSPDVPPGESGFVEPELPADWQTYDVLYITAKDPDNNEIFTWSLPVPKSDRLSEITASRDDVSSSVSESDSMVIVTCSTTTYIFSRTTGYLERIEHAGKSIPFSGGPRLAASEVMLSNFGVTAQNGKVEIQADYAGIGNNEWMHVKWSFGTSRTAKLAYQYRYSGDNPFMGLTFDLPQQELVRISYLGYGPYRVWKNRLRGQRFGLWEKLPNNTVTGESYDYPEFPGYYAGVRQAVIQTRSGRITVSAENEDVFLQLYRPADPAGAFNTNTSPASPQGDIGFLTAIPAIGTKFQTAASMGPQSQLNAMYTTTPIKGVLYFTVE